MRRHGLRNRAKTDKGISKTKFTLAHILPPVCIHKYGQMLWVDFAFLHVLSMITKNDTDRLHLRKLEIVRVHVRANKVAAEIVVGMFAFRLQQ